MSNPFWMNLSPWAIIFFMLIVCAGLAFIPAALAKDKGYSYGGFWVFGFFAFLPALIVSLCIRTLNNASENIEDVHTPQTIEINAGVTSFCHKCGTKCTEDMLFCNVCGTKLKK